MVALDLAHRRQQSVAGQPLGGEDALGAVAQLNHALTGAGRRQDRGQGDQLIFLALGARVAHPAAQLEPVDPAVDAEGRAARAADHFLIGAHHPATLQEFADGGGHEFDREYGGGLALEPGGGAGPEAQVHQSGQFLVLAAEVAADQRPAARGLRLGGSILAPRRGRRGRVGVACGGAIARGGLLHQVVILVIVRRARSGVPVRHGFDIPGVGLL